MNKVIEGGDKLKFKVLDSRLFGSLYSAERGKDYEGFPIFLRLKEPIKKRGQILFGELKIVFIKQSQSEDFVFEGPFTCVIGNQ